MPEVAEIVAEPDELKERLDHINFLCKSTALLLRRLLRAPDGGPGAEDGRQLWFMLSLYAESFYYFAHRVQDILGKPKARLPHVSGFVRCQKITVIRNALIEHAYLKNDLELGGQKDVMSLGDGPISRSNQGDGPKSKRDLGIFVNARELKEAVYPVLERALNAVGGYVNDGDALAAPLEQAK